MKDRKGQNVCTTSGMRGELADTSILPGGQQKDYLVLCPAEREKGFVRPYRDKYKHLKCGAITSMGKALSETYARDPSFYGATFCVACGAHFPVGANGEFEWVDDGTKVGT